MKSILTFSVAIMASIALMAQTPTIALTAKSSVESDWNKKYDNVTINVVGAALAEKKPCGVTVKENAMSISSSDSHWIEISCEDGLSRVVIAGSGNSSGTTDWVAPLCVCSSAPFDSTIFDIIAIHYTGYDKDCQENDISLPAGTKSVRLYRRMKVNSDKTQVGSGSNWTPTSGTGNQTFNITYLAAYAGASAPVTDPISTVTLTGPNAVFIGQKASYTASTDKKATAYKWTVNNVEQNGVTGATFDYTPSAAGTYTIQAYAKNEYNTDWVVSNTINLVASEKTELVQVSIDKTTVWDWTKAGTGSIEWTASTTPRKDLDTVVLANIDGINNNADFNSQALRFAGQYPIRDGKYCQGPWISFKTTVAGYVQVDFSNTGTKDEARYIAINGVVNTEVGTKNTTAVTSANIAVPAGDVVIEGSFDPYAAQYLRIYKINFSTDAPPVVLSSDATLKSIVYGSDQTPVPNFSADKLNYTVELAADYVGGAPSVQASANDAKATMDITQATTLPGTATILVTAEDGTTTKTYTVTFTKESAAPKVESATWANIQGTAMVDNVSLTITGQVTNGSSLMIEPQFTGKNISSYTPTGAQDFSTGAINYTFKSTTNEEITYAVTITEAPVLSSDATLKSLTYGGTSVPNFSPNTYVYSIELSSGLKTPPTIAAVANDAKAKINITQAASVPGTARVVVTAEDGTQLTYTVNYTTSVPSTDLTLHEPEKYEAKEMEGGYNTPLTVYDSREYEVYYMTRDADSKFCIATTNADKTAGITTRISGDYNCAAKDGWFTFSGTGWSSSSDAPGKEFATMSRRLDMDNTCEFSMHIKGFDQFALVARDKKKDTSSGQTKPEDNRYLEVYIDDVLQPQQFNTDPSIRRYDISTNEHVVRVVHIGSEKSAMYGFSLRVAQEPRTKYLTGNDSSQVLKPFGAILPVTYATKYNNIPGAETKLEWIGAAADGIQLKKVESVSINQMTDTFLLTGNAYCPAGEYKYAVVAYLNDIETSRAEGTFSVKNDIKAVTDTSIVAYEGENMDEIKFRYYVFDETKDITIIWNPAEGIPGVTTTAKNGFFTISGIPTAQNTYHYLITVEGGDTITGTIKVESSDLGQDPVLYLYQSKTDYIYTYLKECGYNLKERKTKDNLRSAKEYGKYKWILISEDVNANNPEVFKIMRGGVDMPILNMKAFSYAHAIDSLKDAYGGSWGEADNGSLSENGKYITVWRDDHPIFKAINKKQGDRIQVLDSIERKGLMPIKVTQGGLCLATALKRDRIDYYGDGDPETFLHEKPAGLDGGNSKYISFPVSMSSSKYLSDEGKNLLKATIEYLLSNNPSVRVPEVRIVEFKLGDIVVRPEIGTYTITLEIDTTEHPELADLTEVVPEITLASPYTFTIPAQDSVVNMSYAPYMAFNYVVSDYIHREVYNVKIVWRKPQGIEEVYSVGQWVNVYDMFGRKVATTNEDIYTMSLPRGVYIIVTENGQTLKISR